MFSLQGLRLNEAFVFRSGICQRVQSRLDGVDVYIEKNPGRPNGFVHMSLLIRLNSDRYVKVHLTLNSPSCMKLFVVGDFGSSDTETHQNEIIFIERVYEITKTIINSG